MVVQEATYPDFLWAWTSLRAMFTEVLDQRHGLNAIGQSKGVREAMPAVCRPLGGETERERVGMPSLSQLRAVKKESQTTPPSEDSVSSSASPRSGLVRAHPYRPVEGSVERSSVEMVPSSVSQAPCVSGIDESLNVTPIRRASSSPNILPIPLQVMSPNLATGSVSSVTPPQKDDDQGFDPDVARSTLQQWAEIKIEDGSVERVFTQVAQTWPLADNVKFENIEAAIHVLQQACD